MKPDSQSNAYPECGEAERFDKVIADLRHVDNILLKEFTHLNSCYKKLVKRANMLSAENEQFKNELVNMVRSLNLASRIDGMTGLANRRDIMEKINREATRSHRHQRTFSILLVNIDDFRKVNDIYGYNAGDDVLVEIARVLMSCVRNEDICARWGGDEFMILLPETGTMESLPVAKKVLEALSMTEFKANKPGIHITVSIGVCEHDPAQSVQECISRVHQALLHAKSGGKNLYIIAA
ncbi:MAG: GGDEF domain-containing protein [Desulfobacteraceae bacterium]|nr:GGDEF domain-containing protein [Desulfobacteraceae bacterium]